MNVLVTGGAGFIGSHLVEKLLEINQHTQVVVLDKLTYAGRMDNLPPEHPRITFSLGDVSHRDTVRKTLEIFKPQVVYHLAAETHVTRSQDKSTVDSFIHTNLIGTYVLLDECLRFQESLSSPHGFRVVYVSTDEVYGSCMGLPWIEESPYEPNNPYSASKAAADHIARAWHRTWGLNVVTIHGANNYGPRQHKEKLIPAVLAAMFNGEEILIHGDGKAVRDWLYVKDFCDALLRAAANGIPGTVYNVPGDCERSVLEIVTMLASFLRGKNRLTFVPDRPGNDRRYAMQLRNVRELGWLPGPPIEDRLASVIDWYLANPERF